MKKNITIHAGNVDKMIKKVQKVVRKAGEGRMVVIPVEEKEEKKIPTVSDKVRVQKPVTLLKKTIQKAEEKSEKRNKQKQNEYKLFSVWLALPRKLLAQTPEDYEKLGLDDPMYIELLEIKDMKAFAKKYSVNQDTLTDWRRELTAMKNDKEMHNFFDQFTKSLVLSFYKEQLRRPSPQGLETWYEIIKDRKKNLNINLDGDIKTNMSDEERAALKAIIAGVRRK